MKIKGWHSLQDIADYSGLGFDNVYYRARKLGLKARRISHAHYYSDYQRKAIVDFVLHKKPNQKNNRKKITYIEFFFKIGTAKGVARTLNASRYYVTMAIEEWNRTGCVTVESKMNYE